MLFLASNNAFPLTYFMWQAVRCFSSLLHKNLKGERCERERGEEEKGGGCHIPVNTPIKANSPETVRGTKEHHYDNPDPRNLDFKGGEVFH